MNRNPLLLLIGSVLLSSLLVGCLPQVIVVTEEVPIDELTAVSPTEADLSEADNAESLKIVVIQHGLCFWDTFWCPVEQGVYDAAIEYDVDVQLLGTVDLDTTELASLVDEAVALRPDGIALTLPDLVRQQAAIQRALDAGIPVIVFHTGTGPNEDGLDYLTYIGQDEYVAGQMAAERLLAAAEGAGTRAVCVNGAPGNPAADRRCEGFAEVMVTNEVDFDVLETSPDPNEVRMALAQYFAESPDTDLVLTIAPVGSDELYSMMDELGMEPGSLTHGTFDLTESVAGAIRRGQTAFAVDQQPYLEGYLAVQWLVLYNRYGLTPPQGLTATGPVFVDHSNLQQAEELIGTYR